MNDVIDTKTSYVKF